MKHYYYADKDQQLGPFTFEELKSKRLKKTTLVWTEGMQDWDVAEKINELKEILISEPPPLPPKNRVPQSIETIIIKQAPEPKTSKKYDLTYEKETEATFIGIFLFIVPIGLSLSRVITFETIESYNQGRTTIAIISLILRIAITVWVVNIATRQNRNSSGWGWFAFFLPSIALIVIGLLKKLRLKVQLDDNLSVDEKVAILLEKANKLFSTERYAECTTILDKAIEFDNKNVECLKLKDLITNRLKDVDDLVVSQNTENRTKFELIDGDTIYVNEITYNLRQGLQVFDKEDQIIQEGKFILKGSKSILVKNGIIESVYYLNQYGVKDKGEIVIEQKDAIAVQKGDKVFQVDRKKAEDGEYRLSRIEKVYVQNGEVIKRKLLGM